MAIHHSTLKRLEKKRLVVEQMCSTDFISYIKLLIQKKTKQKFDPLIPENHLVDLITKLSNKKIMTDTQFHQAEGIFAFYKKVSKEEDFPIKK